MCLPWLSLVNPASSKKYMKLGAGRKNLIFRLENIVMIIVFAYVVVSFLASFHSFCCLTLCRSNAAHTDVNKALLWRLSRRTPATAVAAWTEKLLCDFQKPIESHSVKCGSVCSLWFLWKPYDWPNNEMLSSAENKVQSADPNHCFTN